MPNVGQTVTAAVQNVAEERALELEAVQDHHMLVDDLGFTSLDLARIIAMLEFELDADPFASDVPITSIRTVGDLSMAYASCFTTADRSEEEEPADTASANTMSSTAPRWHATDSLSARDRQRELRQQARGKSS